MATARDDVGACLALTRGDCWASDPVESVVFWVLLPWDIDVM